MSDPGPVGDTDLTADAGDTNVTDRDVTEPGNHRAAFAAGAHLRVVNWHNTPASGRARLRAELAAYLRRYDPVTPDDLDRLVDTGRWARDRPGVLIAFYDGYRNNVDVAAPVCDELGLTAWFFPPTAFLDVPPEEQHAYADAHDITLVPEERGQDRVAMTWDELAVVSRRHVVAAHTANHATLASLVTPADVAREVTDPVRRLAELTGRTPPAAAFLYGRPFDPTAPGWRGAVDAGVRYAVSNTAVQRIA